MEKQTYSREDFKVLMNGFPERGLFCKKCTTYIPIFEELTDDDVTNLLKMKETQPVEAIRKLVLNTGCPQRFAKIWVIHGGKPHKSEVFLCPYCNKPLRTSESKQCRHCLRFSHV